MAMPILYAIVASILVYGIGLLLAYLIAKKKKADFSLRARALPLLFDVGCGLAATLIVALILAIFSGGLGALNGIVFFALVQGVVLLFRPHRFFHKKNAEDAQKPSVRKIVALSLIGVGLLIETFAFNFRSIQSYGEVQELAATSLVCDKVQADGENIFLANKSSIIIEPTVETRNIRLNFVPTEDVSITVTVETISGTGFANPTKVEMDGRNVDFHIFKVPVSPRYRLTFQFGDHYLQKEGISLKGVTLNAKPQAYLGITRFAFYSGVVLLVCYSSRAIDLLAKKKKVDKTPYFLIGGFALFSLVAAVIFVLARKESIFVPYPMSQDQLASSETDIFVALFDAFRKGQAHLDITPDPKLLALENPYSPAQRTAARVSYLWDHAFYNGKYYSYYGPLPVLLVSFPLYLFSGMQYVPNAFALEVVGMAALIPAFLLLLLEIYRFARKEISWSGYVLLAGAGILTSMMVMALTFKDGYYHEAIYHVPDIYGLLFFDLFLFFVLRAYRKEKGRAIELALSGLCFVAVIAARPNLVLGVLIALPFYLSMLFRKQFNWKQKAVQFVPMAGILLLGAIAICAYNKIRFDSIMEFGQSYQLNVTDQRTLTYSPDKFFPSFLHFYFQGPAFNNGFPFISASVVRFSFDNCPYISGYFGTMLIPMFALTWLLPFFYWQKPTEQKAFSIIFPLFMVLFAFTTYSKAGICARYLIEQYHLMTIAFFFLILRVADKYEKTAAYRPLMLVGGGSIAISAFLCLCLSFDGFDGMNAGDFNGFLLLWKEAFYSFSL